jgi:hypothetical protein
VPSTNVTGMHGLRHLLTPGSPGYAALKLGAVAGVIGLRVALHRRSTRAHRDAGEAAPPAETSAQARRSPHPRSKKKRKRR